MSYKQRLLAFILLLTSFGCTRTDQVLPKAPSSIESQEDYYTYSNGRIFIGDIEFLESLEGIEDTDILVVDQRRSKDPNMKILDSYKITNYQDIIEILRALLDYEKKDPTDWSRTIRSMRNELIYHNMAYLFNYKPNHSKDVDLNNADEDNYRKMLVREWQ